MGVAIGVDSHKSSLSAAAVDELGRRLAVASFANHPRGHQRALEWIETFPEPVMIGIEGSQRYGLPLARFLTTRGQQVAEVPATLTARERGRQRNQGKSDPVDACAIARVVIRGEGLSTAERDSICVDLKLLSDWRDQLIHTRTRLANQTHKDLVILAPGYERRVPNLVAAKHLAAALKLLRGLRSVRAQLVRRRIAELRRLDAEAARVRTEIEAKVAQSSTSLTKIHGVGSLAAARILGEVGDPRRIRSRAAFAAMSGTAPLEASSGSVRRHRLNRIGNRQLNRALYVIALTQARSHPEARRYLEKKLQEGKSRREGLRCLKRHLSNVVYRHLINDLRAADNAA